MVRRVWTLADLGDERARFLEPISEPRASFGLTHEEATAHFLARCSERGAPEVTRYQVSKSGKAVRQQCFGIPIVDGVAQSETDVLLSDSQDDGHEYLHYHVRSKQLEYGTSGRAPVSIRQPRELLEPLPCGGDWRRWLQELYSWSAVDDKTFIGKREDGAGATYHVRLADDAPLVVASTAHFDAEGVSAFGWLKYAPLSGDDALMWISGSLKVEVFRDRVRVTSHEVSSVALDVVSAPPLRVPQDVQLVDVRSETGARPYGPRRERWPAEVLERVEPHGQ